MPREKKRWSYVTGKPGRNWVRAFEEAKTRILYLEWYEEDPSGGAQKRKRKSLGHRDRDRAKDAADDFAAAIRHHGQTAAPTAGDLTIGELFDRYLREETPHKGAGKQAHDRRTARLFVQHLGAQTRVKHLNRGHWTGFIRARRSYEVAPPQTIQKLERRIKRGEQVEPLGNRQIEYDLKFLWGVLNWAVEGDQQGRQLIKRNPLKGVVRRRDWPREENPARPKITEAQYLAMLEVAPSVDWRFELALVLAHETGHRIGSVRQLRWADSIALDVMSWRKENDKIGMDHRTPLTTPGMIALQRARERNPDGDWIFPHPHADHAGEPCSRHVMRTWWNEAQRKAGLDHVERLGWHSLRRKFANDLRQVPLKDLAQLGGWKDVTTILQCYLSEDMDAMREALGARKTFGDAGRSEERRYG